MVIKNGNKRRIYHIRNKRHMKNTRHVLLWWVGVNFRGTSEVPEAQKTTDWSTRSGSSKLAGEILYFENYTLWEVILELGFAVYVQTIGAHTRIGGIQLFLYFQIPLHCHHHHHHHHHHQYHHHNYTNKIIIIIITLFKVELSVLLYFISVLISNKSNKRTSTCHQSLTLTSCDLDIYRRHFSTDNIIINFMTTIPLENTKIPNSSNCHSRF